MERVDELTSFDHLTWLIQHQKHQQIQLFNGNQIRLIFATTYECSPCLFNVDLFQSHLLFPFYLIMIMVIASVYLSQICTQRLDILCRDVHLIKFPYDHQLLLLYNLNSTWLDFELNVISNLCLNSIKGSCKYL